MSYHNEIMNLPTSIQSLLYKEGHRDARHAAAEIALKAEAKIEQLTMERDEARELVSRWAASRAEIGRLKVERESTCTMCNMMEREVCAEEKVNLRAKIEQLQTQLEEYRGALRDHETMVRERDAEIEDKEASLDMMRSRLGERETLLRQCRQQNERLRLDVERLQARIEGLIIFHI